MRLAIASATMRSSPSSIQWTGGDIQAPETSKRERSTAGPASPTAMLRCSRTPVLLARLTRIARSQRPEGGAPGEAVEPTQDGEPGLLHDLLGDGPAGDEGAGDAHHRLVVSLDQSEERLLVPGAQPREEFGVVALGTQGGEEASGPSCQSN